jgi:2-polyprenyl-3-methyl-5-hydroxy-6-metoxy-1,4-benzoquinol methylase
MIFSIPAPTTMPYICADSADYLKYTEFDASPTHRNRLGSIVAMLSGCGSDPKKIRVLEVGCGVGNICIPLASLGYDVTAGDIHLPSVEKARAKNIFANLTFINEPLSRMSIGSFDVIILTEVLEHVTTYREMLATLALEMKPGARLILTFPNGQSLCERLLRPSYFIKRYPFGRLVVKFIKRVLGGRDLTTANEQTPHVNFFTLPALEHLFASFKLRTLMFQRYFVNWLITETLFSERDADESRAIADFNRSQRTPPARCALWAFMLEK